MQKYILELDFKKQLISWQLKYLRFSFPYLVIMSFTVRQPFSLIMSMTKEWLLTLGAHKMLKKNKQKKQYKGSCYFKGKTQEAETEHCL